ncbi:hypothetical protein BGZ72_002673 [Mortierella alpina]|nr:hypothetical protein BGZ72_002673 [Mortierella alpina]
MDADVVCLQELGNKGYDGRFGKMMGPICNESCLRVVSYNILSNTLANISRRFRNNIHYPDPLMWRSRTALLLTEIRAMDADIVCVQELDKEDYDGHFGTVMRWLGYKGAYAKGALLLPHGFAVYYRIERVELVKSYAVPCPEKEILEEIDHAGLLVVLDVADEGKVQRVCVGTTHVVCSHARGFRKLGQIMALLSAAKVLMRRDPSMPLILTGDFNAYAGTLLTELTLIGSLLVPCPNGEVVTGIDHAGVLAVLDAAEGNKTHRLCVATTHIVCSSIKSFSKLAQVMALISAAKVLMRRDSSMPLSDMNALWEIFKREI